jgi:DNA segregation ATPase FtsK/SpoIIIE-like protein
MLRGTELISVVDDKQSFRVVTTGRILDGFDRAKVQVDLAKVTRLDSPTVEHLLAGTPHVVKQNLDVVTAETYVRRLRAIGVECNPEPEFLDLEPQPLAQSRPTPSAPAFPAPDSTSSPAAIPVRKSATKQFSVVHVLGVLVFGLVGLLFLFHDHGPFPIFAPANKQPSAPRSDATKLVVKQDPVESPSPLPKAGPKVQASSAPAEIQATQSPNLSDLSMLRAKAEQLASIENDFSASEVKFRELMTYGVLTKDLPESEKEQFNAEFRHVAASITTTLGRSKRVLPISLRNSEASRHLRDAIAAHKTWSATQSKKYYAILGGDLETAMRLASDDTAANAEAASLLMAYKALGAEYGR